MRKDLPPDQRMLGVNMMPLQAEDLLQLADQGLANLGHGGMPLAA